MTDDWGKIDFAAGPWDVTEAPADHRTIDFGPLKVPFREQLRIRSEMDVKSRRLGAVSLPVNDCEMQLQVLAAPRGQGIWGDVRHSLVAQLKKRPGHQQVVEGRFGPELIATITSRTADGLLKDTVMRFVGVDGPRWMLRVVVVGPSVTSDATVARVNAVISNCVIARGEVAAASAEVLELSPPPGMAMPSVSGGPAS
jgi:hypothetical protein